jgi:hypothetical protein
MGQGWVKGRACGSLGIVLQGNRRDIGVYFLSVTVQVIYNRSLVYDFNTKS